MADAETPVSVLGKESTSRVARSYVQQDDPERIAIVIFPAIMKLIQKLQKTPVGKTQRYELGVLEDKADDVQVVVEEMLRITGAYSIADIEIMRLPRGEEECNDVENDAAQYKDDTMREMQWIFFTATKKAAPDQ